MVQIYGEFPNFVFLDGLLCLKGTSCVKEREMCFEMINGMFLYLPDEVMFDFVFEFVRWVWIVKWRWIFKFCYLR